jgi:hypothetical protein
MEPLGKCSVTAGKLKGECFFFRWRAPLGIGRKKMEIESGVNRRLSWNRMVDG